MHATSVKVQPGSATLQAKDVSVFRLDSGDRLLERGSRRGDARLAPA